MPRFILPPERHEEFRVLAARMTDEQLHRHFGFGKTTAMRYRRRLGVVHAAFPPPTPPLALTPDEQNELCQLALFLSDEQLGEYFGIGESTARRYRDRLKIIRAPLPTARPKDAPPPEVPHAILTPACYAEFRELAQRLSNEQLAEYFDITETVAERYRKRLLKSPAPHPQETRMQAYLRAVQKQATRPLPEIEQEYQVARRTAARHRKAAGQQRRSGPIPRRAKEQPIIKPTVRWRCWKCQRLNIGADICETPRCRTQLGRK